MWTRKYYRHLRCGNVASTRSVFKILTCICHILKQNKTNIENNSNKFRLMTYCSMHAICQSVIWTANCNNKQLHISGFNERKLVNVSKLLVNIANYFPNFLQVYVVFVTIIECILNMIFCYYVQICYTLLPAFLLFGT